MKLTHFCLILVFLLSACNSGDTQDELRRKTLELTEKEQSLNIWAQELKIKEEQLLKREKLVDSATLLLDSFGTYNPAIIGNWTVTMRCVETTCEGSAIGDTKTEHWDISYDGNTVIAKVIANEKLVRVYKGKMTTKTLQLSVKSEGATDARMNVILTVVKEGRMEGQREIIQASGCRVVYTLEVVKA